ncbi:hypothetical protein IAU60_004837 [Kwoniella sp. DSM 27419]
MTNSASILISEAGRSRNAGASYFILMKVQWDCSLRSEGLDSFRTPDKARWHGKVASTHPDSVRDWPLFVPATKAQQVIAPAKVG